MENASHTNNAGGGCIPLPNRTYSSQTLKATSSIRMPKAPGKSRQTRTSDGIVVPTTGGNVLSASEMMRFLHDQIQRDPDRAVNSLFILLQEKGLVKVCRNTVNVKYKDFMQSLQDRKPPQFSDKQFFEDKLQAVKDWDKRGRNRIIPDEARIQEFMEQSEGLEQVELERNLRDLLNKAKGKQDKRREKGAKHCKKPTNKPVNAKTVYNYLKLAKRIPPREREVYSGPGRIIEASSMEFSGVGQFQRKQPRFHGRGRPRTLAKIVYADSDLAGKGLKAFRDTPKGTFVTEYSGEFIHEKHFEESFKNGTDTHMLTLGSQFLAIDGSVHGQFTEDWFCTHHKVCRHTSCHLIYTR